MILQWFFNYSELLLVSSLFACLLTSHWMGHTNLILPFCQQQHHHHFFSSRLCLPDLLAWLLQEVLWCWLWPGGEAFPSFVCVLEGRLLPVTRAQPRSIWAVLDCHHGGVLPVCHREYIRVSHGKHQWGQLLLSCFFSSFLLFFSSSDL